MKRRTKQRMTAIHISIPVRLLEDLDDTLSFSQSRSAKVSSLIKQALLEDKDETLSEASTRSLMIHLKNRDDVDETMKALLFQILTK